MVTCQLALEVEGVVAHEGHPARELRQLQYALHGRLGLHEGACRSLGLRPYLLLHVQAPYLAGAVPERGVIRPVGLQQPPQRELVDVQLPCIGSQLGQPVRCVPACTRRPKMFIVPGLMDCLAPCGVLLRCLPWCCFLSDIQLERCCKTGRQRHQHQQKHAGTSRVPRWPWHAAQC